MSGHGFYILGAYLVTAVCLILEIVLLLKRKRETKT